MLNSIRKKLIAFVCLPIVTIYSGVILYNIVHTLRWTEQAVHDRMAEMALLYASKINGNLEEAAQIAETTASFLENSPQLERDQVYAQLHSNVHQNPLVYGAALAFEPFQFHKDVRLFSPYVYREKDRLQQMDIGSDGYDYANGEWDWWSQPRLLGKPIWTEPYLDKGAGDILMCTFSSPFFRQGIFSGVSTVDVPLKSLRQLAFKNLPKDTGFLIVTKADRYIYP